MVRDPGARFRIVGVGTGTCAQIGHESQALEALAHGGMLPATPIGGIRFDDGSSAYPEAMFATQPFSDADLSYFDGDKGSVGIVRRNGAPGEVAVTEITARGDTVWGRTLAIPSVPIGADQVEDTVQHLASRAAASAQRLGSPISAASARRLATLPRRAACCCQRGLSCVTRPKRTCGVCDPTRSADSGL